MLDYKISCETFSSDTKYLDFDELHLWSTEVLKANGSYLQSKLAIPEPRSHRGIKEIKYSISFSICENQDFKSRWITQLTKEDPSNYREGYTLETYSKKLHPLYLNVIPTLADSLWIMPLLAGFSTLIVSQFAMKGSPSCHVQTIKHPRDGAKHILRTRPQPSQ